MKIIIFGANEIGLLIASEFYTDNDIIIIDEEKNKIDAFNKLDVGFIAGNASSVDVLKQAGIKNADVFIACNNSDELNIVACLTAKQIGKVKTLCFVRKEEYKASLGIAKDADYNSEFYIDNVIWPEELLTQEIFRIITVAKALDVEYFASGRARLLEYKLGKNSPLLNKALKHCEFPKDTLITKEILEELKVIFNNGYNLKLAKINEELDTYGNVQTIKIYDPNDKKNKLIVMGNDYNIDVKRLTISDVYAAINYYLNLLHGVGNFDEIDHLGNRRIRQVGELLQNQFRIGVARMERVIRERMTTQEMDEVTPKTLINIRPVTAAMKEFFGSSQLSQFMDQTNSLAELTN